MAKRFNWPGFMEVMARIILGGAFVYASLHKIYDPADFAVIIYGYKILPNFLVNPSAMILPWLEFWAGVLILCGLWLRASVVIINGLLLVFMAAIGFNLWRGLDFDCGCFTGSGSGGSSSSAWWLLIRDFIFLLMGFYILWAKAKRDNKKSYS